MTPPVPPPWQIRGQRLPTDRGTLVMGILNVTPDSFSDGNRFLDPGKALERGLAMAAEGADIIDVGGESTRPGAVEVSAAEELRRILPVIRGLTDAGAPPVSVDTRHPEVAAAAMEAGAAIINDVQASRTDDAMWRIVRDTGAGYVCMHMQGEPGTMQTAPAYRDVMAEVGAFFRDRIERLAALGVDAGRVVIDPGIGFGKTFEHNLTLLRRIGEFAGIGRPILLGISRKSFLGRITGAAAGDRMAGGLACTAWAARQGVRIFRTHDVDATVQVLKVLEAVAGTANPAT